MPSGRLLNYINTMAPTYRDTLLVAYATLLTKRMQRKEDSTLQKAWKRSLPGILGKYKLLVGVMVRRWGSILAAVTGLIVCYGLTYVWELRSLWYREVGGSRLIGAVEAASDEVEDLGVQTVPTQPDSPWRVHQGNEHRFIGSVVRAAKVRFSIPSEESRALAKANRMVVRRYCSDLMTERGMRPTHVSQFMDTVVELVFIPTTQEIEVEAYKNTRAWTSRVKAYKDEGLFLSGFRGRFRRFLRRLTRA